jgi:hypothetical protein
MTNVDKGNDEAINSADRVRRATAADVNAKIDRQIDRNISYYSVAPWEAILTRIEELDREWDIERVLEIKCSSLALAGLVLGITSNRRWLAVPAVVLPFLLHHGLQGWCPPVPLLRGLGVRTRGEIDREKYALKEYLK